MGDNQKRASEGGNLTIRGLRFVHNITTDLSTIPNIDANRLNPPPIAYVAGRRVVGIAPGDLFGCVLCGIVHDSAGEFKLHAAKCTGCPNPNRLEGDGIRYATIKNITKHLGLKDSERDEGVTLLPYQKAEVSQKKISTAERNRISKQQAEVAQLHMKNWYPGNRAAMEFSVPNPCMPILDQLSEINGLLPPSRPSIRPFNPDSSFQPISTGHVPVVNEPIQVYPLVRPNPPPYPIQGPYAPSVEENPVVAASATAAITAVDSIAAAEKDSSSIASSPSVIVEDKKPAAKPRKSQVPNPESCPPTPDPSTVPSVAAAPSSPPSRDSLSQWPTSCQSSANHHTEGCSGTWTSPQNP